LDGRIQDWRVVDIRDEDRDGMQVVNSSAIPRVVLNNLTNNALQASFGATCWL